MPSQEDDLGGSVPGSLEDTGLRAEQVLAGLSQEPGLEDSVSWSSAICTGSQPGVSKVRQDQGEQDFR